MGDRLQQALNSVPTNYTLDLSTGLTQVLADGSNVYLYGVDRIGEQQGLSWAYHLPDALGSVRQLTSSTGTVSLAQGYQPFGSKLTSAGTGSTVFQFTGEQRDGTGLTYLRARYLDTSVGRFFVRDIWPGEVQMPASQHPYLYGLNNPLRNTDPSGRCARGDIACLDAAQDLYETYGWLLSMQGVFSEDIWSVDEVSILLDAARTIEQWFDRHGGNGQARMRAALAPVSFGHSMLPFHHVFLDNVSLVAGFDKNIVFHEMGHILDNFAGGSPSLASIFGGGPSDEMVRFLGVDPTKCPVRFDCDPLGFGPLYADLIEEADAETPPTAYAARQGPSEDFADTFMLSVISDGMLAAIAPQRAGWMSIFATEMTAAREPFEGQPYLWRYPVPLPVPLPDC